MKNIVAVACKYCKTMGDNGYGPSVTDKQTYTYILIINNISTILCYITTCLEHRTEGPKRVERTSRV